MINNILLKYLLLAALCISTHAYALTNPDEILQQIETNNRTLKALRAGNEAIRLSNLTGLNLEDPEVSFSYMWAAKGDIKDKINIGVSQSFDFATLSGAKKKVALSSNELLKLQYREAALKTQLQAREAIVNLTYCNALVQLLDERDKEYRNLYRLADSALQRGQITIMDLNSIKLHKYTIENSLRMARIEQAATQKALDLLNGGIHVEYTEVKYCPDTIPPSFDIWFEKARQNNPALNTILAQSKLDLQNINLAKKEGLPTFSIGYVNEITSEEQLHGVEVGMSIPLWSNAGKVKAAKAAQIATQAQFDDTVFTFLSEMQTRYQKTASLALLAEQYTEMINVSDNKQYLNKSLASGKMSMIDYVTETDAFTDMKIQALDAWKEYHLSLAGLLLYAE